MYVHKYSMIQGAFALAQFLTSAFFYAFDIKLQNGLKVATLQVVAGYWAATTLLGAIAILSFLRPITHQVFAFFLLGFDVILQFSLGFILLLSEWPKLDSPYRTPLIVVACLFLGWIMVSSVFVLCDGLEQQRRKHAPLRTVVYEL